MMPSSDPIARGSRSAPGRELVGSTAVILLAAAVFVVDLLFPLSRTLGAIYAVPVLLAVVMRWRFSPLVVGGGLLVLLALEPALRPAGIPAAPGTRPIALAAVVGAALVAAWLRVRRTRFPRRLEHSHQSALRDLVHALDERVRARTGELEGALAESRLLRAAADQAAEGIAILDPDGRVLYENEALIAVCRHPAGGVTGRRFPLLDGMPAPGMEPRALVAVLERDGRWGTDVTLPRDGGAVATLRVEFSPVRDQDGRVTHVTATARDVTTERQVLRELDESRGRLRNILEHSSNLFYSHTPQHVLTYVSPQARRFFDCEPEEARRRWTDFVTDNPINESGFEATLRAVRTGERQPPYELELRTTTGRIVWVEVNEAPVVRDGATVEIVGALTDITARRRAEEERERVQARLLEASKLDAIGRLAGGVAHDFNNLLCVINGYADMLLADRELSTRQQARVSGIRDSAERASRLTRQLLAFSRRQVLAPQPLDLNAQIRESDRMLRRLIGEHIDLVTLAAEGLDLVQADPGQIDQIVMNLVVNARDAIHDGGTIRLETRRVVVDDAFVETHPEAIRGTWIALTVADTGCGIDADHLPHIFEPFFTTKGKNGTGLGLAAVYGIVRQSGGFILVESESGRGTSFHVHLPISTVDRTPMIGRPGEDTPGGDEVILLAEDDDGVRKVTGEFLRGLGYTVLEAGHGPAALEIAAARPGRIDLLLTDVIMPGMSGRDLARKLAAERPETAVIYMSGFTDDVLSRQGAIEPHLVLIEKPFTLPTLARRIRTMLDGEGSARSGRAA